jgi:hypothetical protein
MKQAASSAYSATPKMEATCSSENRQHGVISQMREFFIIIAVRT